ncbi:MAG: DNA double-strand break repair nuclease NurA [Leptolyngbyaceae cyanobacterium SL_1_1]|nr:DNA double-strand break repair nuclease NurA [Leptolyngbyaceae cyanobacterium RM1_1_2]NJO09024.1 DNA double-strand break repair nuclease NurA [Leptolyngbyaceae cyanobacterium SL_1_1]
MPLKPAEILQQLNDKREQFTDFDQKTLKLLQKYQTALAELSQCEPAELQRKLDRLPGNCGASPLELLSKSDRGVIREHLQWRSREESLAWAKQQIAAVATFAVDGSQIYPSKDISLLVALVQIGWYENLHVEAGSYSKDIQTEIMTPADLTGGDRRELIDRKVNMKRFAMETERLSRYMEERQGHQRCLVFFDGALAASFAELLDDESRRFYADQLTRLLRTSQRCQVPIVGYVDTSYARDLTAMLRHLANLPEASSLRDAQIMNRFMQNHWGDRTSLYLCRADILKYYCEQHDQVTFTYLKSTTEGFPARLELPRWIYESGRLQEVLNWVRAEVIIGGGYPYAIETADQTAVLQARDRQIFYRILQNWTEEAGLNLRLSRKMVSKARRR